MGIYRRLVLMLDSVKRRVRHPELRLHMQTWAKRLHLCINFTETGLKSIYLWDSRRASSAPPQSLNKQSKLLRRARRSTPRLEMFAHFWKNSMLFFPPFSNLGGWEMTQQKSICSSLESEHPVCLSALFWDPRTVAARVQKFWERESCDIAPVAMVTC